MKLKICPQCGTFNDRFFSACKKCYTAIDKVEIVEMSDEKVAELEKASADARKRKLWEESNNADAESRKALAAEDELRKKVIRENKAKLEQNGNLGFYEYKIVSVTDTMAGRANVNDLQKELTTLGRDGWRLVTSFTNELGKNALVGFNGTVDDTVLIFERFVPFD